MFDVGSDLDDRYRVARLVRPPLGPVPAALPRQVPQCARLGQSHRSLNHAGHDARQHFGSYALRGIEKLADSTPRLTRGQIHHRGFESADENVTRLAIWPLSDSASSLRR